VESSDGKVEHDLATPEGMGGPGGSGTNPEQLFAAGYAACFEGALRLVASKQNKDIGDASVTANVGIGPEGKSFGLEVEMVASVPGVSRGEAEELVAQAHEVPVFQSDPREHRSLTRGRGLKASRVRADPHATRSAFCPC
jgi:Ohr subfamily peroxiredoxin